MWRLGVSHSYTMEAAFGGSTLGEGPPRVGVSVLGVLLGGWSPGWDAAACSVVPRPLQAGGTRTSPCRTSSRWAPTCATPCSTSATPTPPRWAAAVAWTAAPRLPPVPPGAAVTPARPAAAAVPGGGGRAAAAAAGPGAGLRWVERRVPLGARVQVGPGRAAPRSRALPWGVQPVVSPAQHQRLRHLRVRRAPGSSLRPRTAGECPAAAVFGEGRSPGEV